MTFKERQKRWAEKARILELRAKSRALIPTRQLDKLETHDLPTHLRQVFEPEIFYTHLKALVDFKMPAAQCASELANLCNLIFIKFLTTQTRPLNFDYVSHPDDSYFAWSVTGERTHPVNLPRSFRGRVLFIGIEKNSRGVPDKTG